MAGFEEEQLGHLLFSVYEDGGSGRKFRGQTVLSLSELLSLSREGSTTSGCGSRRGPAGPWRRRCYPPPATSRVTGDRPRRREAPASGHDPFYWGDSEIRLSVSLEALGGYTPLTAPLTPKVLDAEDDENEDDEAFGKTTVKGEEENEEEEVVQLGLYTKRKDIEITHFAERAAHRAEEGRRRERSIEAHQRRAAGPEGPPAVPRGQAE